MDQGTCEECGAAFDRAHPLKRFCCEAHQRLAEKRRYRAKTTEQAECKQCGKPFIRTATSKRKRLHCSEACSLEYRSEALGIPCDHGPSGGEHCPACTFVARAQAVQLSARPVMRADPCSYCGTKPSGIDHIEPKDSGGLDEWDNWTNCCLRCNAIKSTLPLLKALRWMPVSREYHDLRRTLLG